MGIRNLNRHKDKKKREEEEDNDAAAATRARLIGMEIRERKEGRRGGKFFKIGGATVGFSYSPSFELLRLRR